MGERISGDLVKWDRLWVDFTGPALTEAPQTFSDYRLDVTFKHSSGHTIKVPGFFAADGNAGNSHASTGTIWRAYFNPPEEGTWTYSASFRHGAGVAAKLDPKAGAATAFDGASGRFVVAPASTDKDDGVFRTQGMVVQKGQYLVHEGSGKLFLKAGADSPENFLGYKGFDGTKRLVDLPLHDYSEHLKDWRTGDPSWDGGKGKEIIGAINYLAAKGINAQYFLSMNVGGDGQDVWPWISEKPEHRKTYDVSKLDQWETVFNHMDDKGVLMHFVTQETENDQLLGGLTEARMIYYREMIARFGHHNGLIWNLGEENSNTTAERKAFADYIKAVDPYDHVINVHNWPGTEGSVFGPLLGHEAHDGVSLQKTNGVREEVAKWVAASQQAGDPWVVTWDETGPAGTGILRDNASGAAANHDKLRANMWGALTAGAAGIEWYAGGEDQSMDNFRTRDSVWTWTAAAKDFYQSYLPAADMRQADALTSGTNVPDYVFAQPGSVYAIYLPDGGTASLDLRGVAGNYTVDWFDPRHGGALLDGSVTSVKGGGVVGLGRPPADAGADWVILVRASGAQQPTSPAPAPLPPPGTHAGTEGADRLIGTSAADHLLGFGGNDRLDGGAGADRMEGGKGSDTYIVDHAADLIIEYAGAGSDQIESWVSYNLPAEVEKLLLLGSGAIAGHGNALANHITGNLAANVLEGGAGDDKLIGRGGADVLTGGAGKDIFDYNVVTDSRGAEMDRIRDFTKGQDRIDLSTIDANKLVLNDQAFAFIGTAGFGGHAGQLRYAHQAGSTHVYADINGDRAADFALQIDGVVTLGASDFLL